MIAPRSMSAWDDPQFGRRSPRCWREVEAHGRLERGLQVHGAGHVAGAQVTSGTNVRYSRPKARSIGVGVDQGFPARPSWRSCRNTACMRRGPSIGDDGVGRTDAEDGRDVGVARGAVDEQAEVVLRHRVGQRERVLNS